MWNHDLFLTDDFLGQLSIPLKEVPVLEYGREGDAAESGGRGHAGCRVGGTVKRLCTLHIALQDINCVMYAFYPVDQVYIAQTRTANGLLPWIITKTVIFTWK